MTAGGRELQVAAKRSSSNNREAATAQRQLLL